LNEWIAPQEFANISIQEMKDDSFARGLEFVNETQIATYF
jgi:hypothetical protein